MGLDLAARCVADGHEVRWFRPSPRTIGEGFAGVKIVDDWRASMAWAGKDGLIVTTGNAKWTTELDRYRDLGFGIFGPTAQSAALEIDRAKGMAAMKSVGIDLPHYETFDTLEAAQVFARKADQAYVFKPMGSEDDKALTFVSKSPAEMVGWLQRQIDRGMRLKAPCMLQEKIDMVAEIGVSGWFGPEGFLPEKYQLCFEYKKLMNDDKGPSTGEMGSCTAYVAKDKLADEFLLPFAPILQALGHRGDFAIGCGMDAAGKVWPFEFTSRLGWPAFFIQVASHKGDVAQWMRDLLDGKDTLKVDYRPAIGVCLCQPPFPQWNGKPECVEGNPIAGMDEVWDQVHPAMMRIGKGPFMDGGKVKDGPVYQTAGELVAVVTGLGSTVSKARKSVYGAIDEISFSDMMLRTDIGSNLEEQLPLLHKAGLALEMDYE
jgi:phosphoribosylamine--glycine ligase